MAPLSILVVDDVEQFAELLARSLRHNGHTVSCAGNGRAAAELLAKQNFDLIVTDIVMPSGDGLELIEDVKRVQPKAKILAMSGGGSLYSANACLEAAVQSGTDAALQKPFSPQALLETIAKLFPQA